MGVALLLVGYPQISAADTQQDIFKSSTVIQWNKDQQRFFLEASIRMAGLIAARNSAQQSKCLDEWYIQKEAQRHEAILQKMAEYPDYHPSGIILAYLEKQCGSLVYVTKR